MDLNENEAAQDDWCSGTRLRRMDALLRPRSVAVVGASPNPSFVSLTLKNLLRNGYPGTVVAVNPRYEQVDSVPCYPSLSDVPHDIDLVIVGVAARWLPSLLEEAEHKRVGALEIITSGFAEIGAAGAQRQAELTAWAQRTGIVVGGPNCLGLLHAPTGLVALPTTVATLQPGVVGLVLQSGMMAPSVLVPLLARGIGVTFAATTGNEADLEAADYIRYYVEDDATRVIGVFAEQIKTPSRFMEACALAAERRKPIVMLKIGRSEAARRAALAHTGSLAGADAVVDAVLRRLGVSRVDSIDELLEYLAVFHSPRLPRGGGVAAVIVSGGAAGLLSDLAPRCGISFPQLPEPSTGALRAIVPEFGSVGNPLDVTGQAVFDTPILQRALDVLAETPGIDVIIYARGFPSRLDRASPTGQVLEQTVARHPDTVFLTLGLAGGHFHPAQSPDSPPADPIDRLGETPFLQGSEYGLKAVAALIRYADFIRSGDHLLPARTRPVAQHEPGEGKAILARYGIPLARERRATSLDEALAAARDIGYPVALKVESPTLLHKTDAGAVSLNIQDAAGLERSYAHLQSLGIDDARGVLVQEMVPHGTEMILGMTRDPQFGPIVAVGLGGIFVEILDDVQLLVPPVSAHAARRALEKLRGYKVLRGARGQPPADVDALVEAIVRFSKLCLDVRDHVQEIDINPLIVLEHGVRAVDCLIVPSQEVLPHRAHQCL